MTIERRNPLPIGRYWIDIFDSGNAAWQGWLASNASTVRVESTQDFDASGTSVLNTTAPARRFIIFVTTAPTPWPPNMGIGLPTIADSDVNQSDDTVVKPPPEKDPLDKLSDWGSDLGKTIGTTIAIAAAAVVAIGAFTLVGRMRRRR